MASSTPNIDPRLPDALAQWLPQQRWYPAKGGNALAPVRIAGGFELEQTDPDARWQVLYVEIDDGGTPVLLNVPVSVRRDPLDGVPEGALIGRGAGDGWLYDGPEDPRFVAAWFDQVVAQGRGAVDVWTSDWLRGQAGHTPPGAARVMRGEQSNTSVLAELAGNRLMAKLYRVLKTGDHPEVQIGEALSRAGSRDVPALHAAVQADLDTGTHQGHATLCVIHDFIAGGRDGWELALAAARSGTGFAALARDLGATLGRVHEDLRASLGGTEPSPEQAAEVIDALIGRLHWAWDIAAEAVGGSGNALAALIEKLRRVRDLPALQRIHGDLHLGQTLHTATAGTDEDRDGGNAGSWYILDFEGEPLRAMAERGRPDLPLRDVVGMLRSFDYAAATATGTGTGGDPAGATIDPAAAEAWARDASEAFLAGYSATRPSAVDPSSVLFQALWLDKALYEVVYELRNRPTWVSVPVAAVRKTLQSIESGAEMTDGKLAPLEVDQAVLASVSDGAYYAPHDVLGAHLDDDGRVTVRTLRHLAHSVSVVTADGTTPMDHEYGGIWTAVIDPKEPGHVPDYRLEVEYATGTLRADEPYRYLPTVGALDIHLIAEGRHETLWTVLGAHVRHYPSELGDVSGVSFAVWAPGVQAVQVIGDFNNWDGRLNAMRSLGTSGVWELFLPDVPVGARYKFRILSRHGQWLEKADPMAFGTEVPPLTASVVVDSDYTFEDSAWMAKRAKRDPHNAPMSVYEVHLGSWKLGLGYKELATELVDYVRELGFTHVELMPVAEHPFGGSWGYQVTSYFAPTARFGHPDEFRHLVDALHQAGIGVIMDWVPAHFPKDSWALAKFNGEAQYEHADPRLGEHPDWGTLIFDFGRTEVRNFLVANALYWLEEFHIDGLRVDAVASMLYLDYSRQDGQWVPNRFGGRENLEAISFLQEMNATAYRRCPGIVTIAEESTAFPGVTAPTSGGGLGFGIKWNMGWMHDTLAYMAEDPINRGWHHNQITFSLVYAFTENFLLPISHDEVVHGKGSMLTKMPGDRWQQLANLRAYLSFQWAHPGKQLIFMGTEFGQETEWSEQYGLDWWLAEAPAHKGLQLLVKQLNTVYSATPALYARDNVPEGFEWINGGDTQGNVLSFLRWDSNGNPLACVVNFSGAAHEDYRIGLPHAGRWDEVLNSDAEEFGGSGVTNPDGVDAVTEALDGQIASAALRVPPLGAVYLKPRA